MNKRIVLMWQKISLGATWWQMKCPFCGQEDNAAKKEFKKAECVCGVVLHEGGAAVLYPK